MDVVIYAGLMNELRKIKTASLTQAGLEVGGLGVLAHPSYKTLKDPTSSRKEKKHAKFELAGLGVLAAYPAYELGHAGFNAVRKLKHGSVTAGALSIFSKQAATDIRARAPNLAWWQKPEGRSAQMSYLGVDPISTGAQVRPKAQMVSRTTGAVAHGATVGGPAVRSGGAVMNAARKAEPGLASKAGKFIGRLFRK
jgi:hypothetical protein